MRGTPTDYDDCKMLVQANNSIDIDRLESHCLELASYDVAEDRARKHIYQISSRGNHKMTSTQLLENLSRLGLPLMETSEDVDVNKTLAEVVKSKDTRLWEGFPVLLANVERDVRFNYDQVLENLPAKREKRAFRNLLFLSLALYEYYHLSFSWSKQLKNKLSDKEKSQFKYLRNSLAHNDQFALDSAHFDPARLRRVFELYFEKDTKKSRQQKEKYEELSLEYALSQIFSPKQKELVKKKLEGLPLTKTEREYYSRAVKKKVTALANAELNRLAQKLTMR
jgi:hypothetical protein